MMGKQNPQFTYLQLQIPFYVGYTFSWVVINHWVMGLEQSQVPLFTVANYLKLFTVSAEGIQTTIFRIGEQSQSAKIEKLKVIGVSLSEPHTSGPALQDACVHMYVCLRVAIY